MRFSKLSPEEVEAIRAAAADPSYREMGRLEAELWSRTVARDAAADRSEARTEPRAPMHASQRALSRAQALSRSLPGTHTIKSSCWA
jgi:hypothetical protein